MLYWFQLAQCNYSEFVPIVKYHHSKDELLYSYTDKKLVFL